MVRSIVASGGVRLTIADALLLKQCYLWFIALIRLVFFHMVRAGAYSLKIHDICACAFAVQTKYSVISFKFLFRRLLWKHETFNMNAEKPKYYSSTVVCFTLVDLLELKKTPRGQVQGLSLVHFDPICFCLFWWKISRYFKAVCRIWQSKNTISFLYTIPNCTE